MAINYVQFLNVGFGIINNTEEVENWDVNATIEQALLLDNPNEDIRIIGFRFYTLDEITNAVIKSSGIYYLQGELFVYPKIDSDVGNFISTANRQFDKGQRLIKIKKPYTLVYAYGDKDTIVDVEPFLKTIQTQKIKNQIEATQQELDHYKEHLLQILKVIEEAVETNSYNRIPFIDSDYNPEIKHLNILNDRGNFMKHIDHLRSLRVTIMNLEQKLSSI